MENASKALIIAGAILISILLISVGIMIFSSSSGLFNSAKTSMSDQEKSLFNQKFTIYEGSKNSATNIKELIRTINANNADDENAPVTINGNAASANNSVTQVPAAQARDGLALLATPAAAVNIVAGKQYTVTITMDQGIVTDVNIDVTN